MFYVKTQLDEDTMITVDITDTNVFCHCPVCGREVPVNLDNYTQNPEFSIVDSEVLCKKCSHKFHGGVIE